MGKIIVNIITLLQILFSWLFQEEEELIEEWQPEPLVPTTPTYDLDVLTPNVVQG